MAEPISLISLTERLKFVVNTSLPVPAALEFVRDAQRSLATTRVLEDLRVAPGAPPVVSASLPISTPLFGRRQLPFVSQLVNTPHGAALVPTDQVTGQRAWAVVGGEAVVAEAEQGSVLAYEFTLTINLDVPEADHWGTRALSRMIELTAATVLKSVSERLRAGIETAAKA